jgi:hypothetical protein
MARNPIAKYLSQIGAKGGNANTPAQKRARSMNARKALVLRAERSLLASMDKAKG